MQNATLICEDHYSWTGMTWMNAKENHSRQSISSEKSPQSSSRSHFQVAGMHRPLLQENWWESQEELVWATHVLFDSTSPGLQSHCWSPLGSSFTTENSSEQMQVRFRGRMVLLLWGRATHRLEQVEWEQGLSPESEEKIIWYASVDGFQQRMRPLPCWDDICKMVMSTISLSPSLKVSTGCPKSLLTMLMELVLQSVQYRLSYTKLALSNTRRVAYDIDVWSYSPWRLQ